MGWSRQRPSNGDDNDPLGPNLRPNQASRSDRTQPLDTDNDPSFFEQDTMVDSNFANRGQARRQRQMRSPINTKQLGAWAANPDNSRKLLTVAAAVVIFLVLISIISIYNRNQSAATANDDSSFESAPALNDPSLEASAPATSLESAPAFLTVQPVPDTNPAQPPAATGGAFVVTGTATEGLFLRPDPSTNGAPIATLPEGTRVQATGNTQNDGTREWREVTSDFGTGWVASDFLQPAP